MVGILLLQAVAFLLISVINVCVVADLASDLCESMYV